jgi:hypothetical protein
MKKRNDLLLPLFILIIVLISLYSYYYYSTSEKRAMDNMESAPTEGNPVGQAISDVRESVESGGKTVLISEVMKSKDNYLCAINTSFGPMSLKVKDGMIREDVIYGNTNMTAFIIKNYAYRYSAQYKSWLRFDYSPEIMLSERQMTKAIFSENEFLSKTSPDRVFCIKMDISKADFDFPMNESLDISALQKKFNVNP